MSALLGVVPPPAKPSPNELSIPPSTCNTPVPPPLPVKAVFTCALPQITIPPQSPERGTGELDVNTIGFSCVPSAMIFAPRVITSAATLAPT